MLKFHIIIIKFSIFTNKNSQSDMFFPKLKNTTVKIDIESFSVRKLSLGNTNKYIRLRQGPKNVECIFARCINQFSNDISVSQVCAPKNYNLLRLDSQITISFFKSS